MFFLVFLNLSRGNKDVELDSNVLFDNAFINHSGNNSTNDYDGDGVGDFLDSCPFGMTSWSSNNISDYDFDGCIDDNKINLEVNDNLSSNLDVEYSQSADGSIYTARSLANSWNDSSGNQYHGLTFTKFVNGSIEWVRTVNTTTPLGYLVGTYYNDRQYSEMFSDEYGVTLLGRTSANKFTYGSKTVKKHMVHQATLFHLIRVAI